MNLSNEILKIADEVNPSISDKQKQSKEDIFRIEVRKEWIKKLLPFLTQKNQYDYTEKKLKYDLVQLTVHDIPEKVRNVMIKQLNNLKKKYKIPVTLIKADNNTK